MSFSQNKNRQHALLITLIFLFLLYDFFVLIYLSIILLKMPANSAPFDGVTWDDSSGNWSGGPIDPNTVNSYYPKSYGFYDASYSNQEASYWLSSAGIVAIILCSLSIINSLIVFLFINRRIKSWFRLSLFNNIMIILCVTLMIQLIIGLGDIPQHFNDDYNKGWQWNDGTKPLDVDWKNWIFGHDAKRDTKWGSDHDAAYSKMYYFTSIGIVFMIFNLTIIVLTAIVCLFGVILTLGRYRSWKRYRRVDADSVDIGLIF